jgi:hypothetical protein
MPQSKMFWKSAGVILQVSDIHISELTFCVCVHQCYMLHVGYVHHYHKFSSLYYNKYGLHFTAKSV